MAGGGGGQVPVRALAPTCFPQTHCLLCCTGVGGTGLHNITQLLLLLLCFLLARVGTRWAQLLP